MGNQSRLYDRLDALPWAALEPGHAEVTYARGRIETRTIGTLSVPENTGFLHTK